MVIRLNRLGFLLFSHQTQGIHVSSFQCKHLFKRNLYSKAKILMDGFKFLVTTDNHLGYKDDDHLRANDSYDAFEEALKIARHKDVDFVLLGGDLFHQNKPSASIELQCIRIIRQHTNANNKKTTFKRIAGSFSHTPSLNHANFEDTNLNIACPIFTIHGNHDDPTGPNGQSVCVKLATSGLINYFGLLSLKTEKIVVEPIILEKNGIKLALYGMGFLPDLKLRSAFEKHLVSFKKPPSDTYNILVIHQNRATVNKGRFIPDEMFPKFFHLIIRGHEHETQQPQKFKDSPVDGLVYQPGSTVATSINIMESLPKKVGIMNVKPDKNKINRLEYELIELETIRPMYVRNIYKENIVSFAKRMSCQDISNDEFKFWNYSIKFTEKTLKEILAQHKAGSKSEKLPIIRVRIEYVNHWEKFDEKDISLKYYGEHTANSDIILFKKQKFEEKDGSQVATTFEEISSLNESNDDDEEFEFEHVDLSQERNTIDTLIENHFKSFRPLDRPMALSIDEYTEALKASRDEGNVIGKVVKTKMDHIMNEFELVIKSEDKAAELFLDDKNVEEWFVKKFTRKDKMILEGGDLGSDFEDSF